MLDVSKLCIQAGSVVWMLKADVVCLEFDGNVHDAALIALVAALLNTKLPVPTITEDGDVTVAQGSETPLQLVPELAPFSLSAVQLHDTLLLDPTEDEEKLADSVLVVASNRAGKVTALCKRETTSSKALRLQHPFCRYVACTSLVARACHQLR